MAGGATAATTFDAALGELPEGIAFDKQGTMYVTDSVGGAIYRVVPGGSAGLWVSDPRLLGAGSFRFDAPR